MEFWIVALPMSLILVELKFLLYTNSVDDTEQLRIRRVVKNRKV